MLTGSCLCGAVAYEADAPLERIVHCHCQTCRKTHGTAFSSVTAVPREKFRWTRGADRLGAIESSPGKFRRFCTQCGSHIMAERVAQPVVLLRLGCLDTPVTDRPQVHIWRSDAAPWYDPKQQFPEKPEGLDMTFLAFHEDEAKAQALAGHQRPGRAAIRPFMPDQHREFFALLPYLFVATPDADGWPMASVLTGEPGFVQSPDPATLGIGALPASDDPAAPTFIAGAEIGLLGLDFTTRRRNRANGRLVASRRRRAHRRDRPELRQLRPVHPDAHAGARAAAGAPVERLDRLDDAARALIAASDTFFVASRSRGGIDDGGLDMSHRGGRPGFVGVTGDTLAIPDFRGNRFYNTLGNLLGDPRAGLLFIDFASGDILQLQGRATIDWHPEGSGPAGAERLWRVEIARAWRRRGAFPFAWRFGDFAPTTLATGTW